MEPFSSPESSPDSRVYTGVWINWSHGQFFGRTLTVNRRDGDLVIAFLALFITIVGTSFWRVTCFAIHYYFSSEAPRDGVYRQRQAILRNSANGASGLWHLIRTVWAWRRNGVKPVSRILPVIGYATLCLCAFGAASGFSSKVSTSVGNEVLISSARYGIIQTESLTGVDWTTRLYPLFSKRLRAYSRYAGQCYTNGSSLARCDTYVKTYLASQSIRNASCPFKSHICRSNDQNIYLDTGLLDIQDDFGMNVPPSKRFQVRIATHCAPLKTEGYKKNMPAAEKSSPNTDATYMKPAYAQYFYGTPSWGGNATYEYPDLNPIRGIALNPSYTIYSTRAYPRNGKFDYYTAEFIPNEDLFRPDADLELVFLSPNDVVYAGPVDDPWYSAHMLAGFTGDGSDPMYLYSPDEPAAVLGCVKQFQVCNPRLPKPQDCTPLQGSMDLITDVDNIFQSEQEASWAHFCLTSRVPEIPQLHEIIKVLGSSSLASSYRFYAGLQAPIPDNQWQLDVEHWNSIFLAGLQGSAVDIAEGPSDPKLRELMQNPRNKNEKVFCRVQKTLSDRHTNFSVFGLALIFTVGIITILLSWFIEPLVGFIQRRRNLDAYARLEWTTNEVLQLQRMAHEHLKMGTWSACDTEVPITERGERLAVLDLGNLKHPRLMASRKGFEHELAEPKRHDLGTGGQEVEVEQTAGGSTAQID